MGAAYRILIFAVLPFAGVGQGLQSVIGINYGAGNMAVADSDPPPGVDYDRWLGPAKERPFNKNRFHGSWRMFRDYGGGLMTDWGVHLIDMGLWAMDVDYAPLSVRSLGGNFANQDRALEMPDTLTVLYEMEGFNMSLLQK